MDTFFMFDVIKLPEGDVDKPASHDRNFALCFDGVLFTEGREKDKLCL